MGQHDYGCMYFLPVYLVTFAVGGFWEVSVFFCAKAFEINESFFVTSILVLRFSLPAKRVPLLARCL